MPYLLNKEIAFNKNKLLFSLAICFMRDSHKLYTIQ
jgi:hypothetical protein